VKSSDSGVSFGAPMEIVDAASQKTGLKFQGEDLAIGRDGRVHVAMANNAWKLKLPQEEWADMVETCRDCDWTNGCVRWLQENQTATEVPPSCPNCGRLTELREITNEDT